MKLEINRALNSRGFRFHSALLSIAAHAWKSGFLLSAKLGRGAGYYSKIGSLEISGRTAFFGWRTRGGNPSKCHGPISKLRFGITLDANAVPYPFA